MLRNLTSLRFFAASLALHGMLLIAAASFQARSKSAPARIAVSLLEQVEKAPEPSRQAPPPPRAPAATARKEALRPAPRAQTKAPQKTAQVPEKSEAPAPPEKAEFREETKVPVAPPARATPREILPEHSIVAERPLPTMRELLPPVNWSSRSGSRGPVSLNTRDPVYVGYFTKIKQLIDAQWEYPELALRHGLQGKLSLEFTIGARGQLERARIIRSSGSQILDDEALRAIKAAAPFPPIPSWIESNPLWILAVMEYHDSRVHYQLTR